MFGASVVCLSQCGSTGLPLARCFWETRISGERAVPSYASFVFSMDFSLWRFKWLSGRSFHLFGHLSVHIMCLIPRKNRTYSMNHYYHHQGVPTARIPLALSLTIHPYQPLLLLSPQDGIQCPNKADKCKSLLINQHWCVHVS